MIKLKVELGKRSYPIFIGDDILGNLGEMYQLFGYGKKAVVITDKTVERQHGAQIISALAQRLDSLDLIAVRPGEASKRMKVVERIITRMLDSGCDRSSTVIAFGGGVVGDLSGFVASIFKRGIRFVQVPTTLLAQVDASVGGKTGINHPLGKNLIGTFYQPDLVWMDLALLRTLPKREIVCGLGEIVKYAIIRDRALFDLLEQKLEEILALDIALLSQIVERCCQIKADVVARDEREGGLRMILNFGHTVGHALEAALGYKEIAHGEAVLLGMLAESRIALNAKLLEKDDFTRIEGLIGRFDLPRDQAAKQTEHLLKFMQQDKKTVDERLKFILPTSIGEVMVADDVKPASILTALDALAL